MNEQMEDTSRVDALTSQIAKRRWSEEMKGVAFKGIRWYADSDGRQAVTETLQFAEMFEAQHGAGSFATDWKGMSGQWAQGVTKADLLQVGQLLGARRQACFARERQLLEQLQADPDAFDEADIGLGWPE